MELFFVWVSILSVIFTVSMVIVIGVTFRKERHLTLLAPLLSLVLSLVMVPIYMLLSGARLHPLLALPVLALGLGFGFMWEFTMRLYYRDGKVMGKYSLLFLIGWAGSWALSLLINLFGSVLLNSLGLIPVFLSTGTQVGMNLNLLIRQWRMRPAHDALLAPPVFMPEQTRAGNAAPPGSP